ncbi:MAG: DUF1905 domain-containing protein [Nocardioides sp.]
MEVEFSGEVWHWKGPAPHHFVTVPDDDAAAIESVAGFVTYGWGMVPVTVRLGDTTWSTSLWPKDGSYLVPLRLAVRRAEGVEVGDRVHLRLDIDV